jgi:uncharacterized Tic20 family protein
MNNYTEQQMQQEPSSDEKLLAMFSHFSIFLGGIILPIIFYFVQKEKSKFVAFHSLQSIFFHLIYLAFVFIFVIVLMILLIAAGVFSHHHSGNFDPETGIGMFAGIAVFYVIFIVSAFAAIGYGIYMGIKAYNGENKKYFLVGNWAWKKVYGTSN